MSDGNDDREYILRSEQRTQEVFQSYPWRWYILFVLCLFQISNAALWLSFSPVAAETADFFDIDGSKVNWLSLVYLIISIPVGLSASWVIDTFGLRAGIIIGTCANGVGAAIRAVAAMNVPSTSRYTILILGQCLGAAAQPFGMFAPTKLAATWFPDSQRATANMLASMSNPLGLLVANILSPSLAPSLDDSHHVQQKHFSTLLWVYAAPCLLAMLMSVFGICNSLPPTPPSPSAAEESEPFFSGLKKVLRDRHFVVLAICFGIGLGLLSTLNTILDQILCPNGYSSDFAGICGALMVGCGIVFAGIASAYADKTKRFEEIMKIGFCLAALAGIGLTISTHFRHAEVPIAISSAFLGIFGFSLFAICMEIGVETTYPVAEATSAGLQIISGQIFGVVFILLFQSITSPISAVQRSIQTCKTDGPTGIVPRIYTVPNYIMSGFLLLSSVLLVLFFRCPYKRLEAERQVKAHISNSREDDLHPSATDA